MNKKIITAICVSSLLTWWVAIPIVNYGKGTSRDVGIQLVAQPFVDSPVLVYRWMGEVFRSCPVQIRRSITDSQGVVTQLVPSRFDALPVSMLGYASYEISVTVPFQIAEGPATYRATEISACNWLERLSPVGIDYPDVQFNVVRG